MTSQVLLIDDLRNFREVPEGVEVTIARTSAQALSILADRNDWDEVWFDHDLGEPEGKLDTTMSVVDYFSEQAFNDTPVNVNTVYVHTSNPVGRKQIATSLARYGYRVVLQNANDIFIAE